ncbi:hypothetical protein BpHYR1_039984 [Brachionus plicatilis]|uniref:Uncharacterized protein n=1 Tax=Brachionus plicatilis TaxID=10195 RepID=A0A3M7SII5_BRAPC|nr:hypothetical protein BpHYR1_039984 [Brachionus plicatilis]
MQLLKRYHTSIDKNVFSNGQAYVALSRVQNANDLHLKRFILEFVTVYENLVRLWEYIKINSTNFQFYKNALNNLDMTNLTDTTYKTNSNVNDSLKENQNGNKTSNFDLDDSLLINLIPLKNII